MFITHGAWVMVLSVQPLTTEEGKIVIIKCSSCSTLTLGGNERHELGREDEVLQEGPQDFIYLYDTCLFLSVSLTLLLFLPLCLSFCLCALSSTAEHSVIFCSPLGAWSKSAQLDHRHQSQAAPRMGHL